MCVNYTLRCIGAGFRHHGGIASNEELMDLLARARDQKTVTGQGQCSRVIDFNHPALLYLIAPSTSKTKRDSGSHNGRACKTTITLGVR